MLHGLENDQQDSVQSRSSPINSRHGSGNNMVAKWQKFARRQRIPTLRSQLLVDKSFFKSNDSYESIKATTLMAACHLGLEHNVSKILWKKVRLRIPNF